MTLFLLRIISTHLHDPKYVKPYDIIKGRASDENFIAYEKLIDLALLVTQHNIKPGGGKKPIYAQMTLAMAYFYKDSVGKRPTRTLDDYSDNGIESYPLLNIVKRMGQTIEQNLPEALWDETLPDLTKASRSAIERMALEEA